MVIAHVLSSFHVGGQEVMAVELATRQRAKGHTVIAVTLEQGEPGPLSQAFSKAGVETKHVPRLGPRLDLTLPFRLARVFSRNSVDIAHLHNHLPLIYGTLASRISRCAAVATRHGLDEGSGPQLWLRRQLAPLAESYIAVSAQVADNTRAFGLAVEPKLAVIENGINISQHEPSHDLRREARAEFRLPENARVIGTVSRLADYKNVGLLLRSGLPHLNDMTRLLIIGDGPERSALESLAAKHPQGQFVHFLGQRTDVAKLLNGMDLFALSSKTEGHPIAVIEAMATGLPILATRVGGIPDMVEDGTTGFLADVEATAFASRFAEALAQFRDWPAMGIAARKFAGRRFSSDEMAERYQTVYDRAKRTRRSL